jgi:hypothetical protein
MAHADRALYRAKLLGRNRVEVLPLCEAGTPVEDPNASTMPMEFQHTV